MTASYTGKWRNIDEKGRLEHPVGLHIFSSEELMTNYVGNRMIDTYVWEPKKESDITIGSKNFLFSVSFNGAKANTVAYSIIKPAKANGFKYLTRYRIWIFVRSPKHLERYVPWSAESQQLCQKNSVIRSIIGTYPKIEQI